MFANANNDVDLMVWLHSFNSTYHSQTSLAGSYEGVILSLPIPSAKRHRSEHEPSLAGHQLGPAADSASASAPNKLVQLLVAAASPLLTKAKAGYVKLRRQLIDIEARIVKLDAALSTNVPPKHLTPRIAWTCNIDLSDHTERTARFRKAYIDAALSATVLQRAAEADMRAMTTTKLDHLVQTTETDLQTFYLTSDEALSAVKLYPQKRQTAILRRAASEAAESLRTDLSVLALNAAVERSAKQAKVEKKRHLQEARDQMLVNPEALVRDSVREEVKKQLTHIHSNPSKPIRKKTSSKPKPKPKHNPERPKPKPNPRPTSKNATPKQRPPRHAAQRTQSTKTPSSRRTSNYNRSTPNPQLSKGLATVSQSSRNSSLN